jgi:hypothetical protein
MASDGLQRRGMDGNVIGRLLGVIEGRCISQLNGAEWQAMTVHHLADKHGGDRMDNLRDMLRRYVTHMHSNEPVHTWPIP